MATSRLIDGERETAVIKGPIRRLFGRVWLLFRQLCGAGGGNGLPWGDKGIAYVVFITSTLESSW